MKFINSKYFTREIIAYILVGVITTLINILFYHLFYNTMYLNNLVANAGAWLISVIFAFLSNDLIVFRCEDKKNTWIMRSVQFFMARGASLLIDELGMFLMVDVLNIYSLISKVVMNAVVVIINYIFSKKVIFQQEEKQIGN